MKSVYYGGALLACLIAYQSVANAEIQTQTFTTGIPETFLGATFEPGSFDYADTSETVTGLPKFDPALGTLTDVIVDFEWSFFVDYFIEAQGIFDGGVPHQASGFIDQMGVGINFQRSDGGSGGSMYFEEGLGVGCFGEPGDGNGCSESSGFGDEAFTNGFSIFGFTDVTGVGSLDIFTVDIFYSGYFFDLDNVGTAFLDIFTEVYDGSVTITYVYDDGVSEPDADGDGVFDATDNCLTVANADQTDVDGDGIGNICDLDFNNDCVTNFLDFAALASAFGPVMGNEVLDANSDGSINFLDIALYTQYHLQPPGPSASGCN
ncbi:MAG: thrombospondin type 3 repeat-containing protein [Gammaproteobacteria bacterium]